MYIYIYDISYICICIIYIYQIYNTDIMYINLTMDILLRGFRAGLQFATANG